MAWCESCNREAVGTVCPVCGGPLLQEMDPERMDPAEARWSRTEDFDAVKAWPVGPDGEPEEPVLLQCAADFESYAGLTISRLEAYGIPVLTRYPDGGQLGKVVLGFSGYGVDLFVPQSRLAQAKELLIPAEAGED